MAETQEPDLAVEFNLRMGQVHPGVTGLCNSSLLALPNLNWARAAKGIAQWAEKTDVWHTHIMAVLH